MDIVLFINCLYAGGAERVTCNLASYLAGKGHHVEILTMSEADRQYELDTRVSVRNLLTNSDRKGKIHNAALRIIRLWKYLLQHKTVDAYIVMLPRTIIMLLAFKWMTGAKVIASERIDPSVYSPIISRLLKYYAARADGFVFQTNDARAWYAKRVKHVKNVVIPNAINKKFLVDIGNVQKKPVIIAAGRLTKQKNFAMLIKAFHVIEGKFPEYQLFIYGDGIEKENLQKLICDLKLDDRVFLQGNTENIIDAYASASVFALTSGYEGMPNVLIEAMALGLPCVSTDCPCGGPRFLIADGKNGLLVPVNDCAAFAKALDKILSSEEFALKLGKEAMKVREILNADKIYLQWEKFVYDVVSVQ